MLYCSHETLQDSLGSVVVCSSEVNNESGKSINATMHNNSSSYKLMVAVNVPHAVWSRNKVTPSPYGSQ